MIGDYFHRDIILVDAEIWAITCQKKLSWKFLLEIAYGHNIMHDKNLNSTEQHQSERAIFILFPPRVGEKTDKCISGSRQKINARSFEWQFVVGRKKSSSSKRNKSIAWMSWEKFPDDQGKRWEPSCPTTTSHLMALVLEDLMNDKSNVTIFVIRRRKIFSPWTQFRSNFFRYL